MTCALTPSALPDSTGAADPLFSGWCLWHQQHCLSGLRKGPGGSKAEGSHCGARCRCVPAKLHSGLLIWGYGGGYLSAVAQAMGVDVVWLFTLCSIIL